MHQRSHKRLIITSTRKLRPISGQMTRQSSRRRGPKGCILVVAFRLAPELEAGLIFLLQTPPSPPSILITFYPALGITRK